MAGFEAQGDDTMQTVTTKDCVEAATPSIAKRRGFAL